MAKRRILVADDYPDAADSLAEVLRLHGYDVEIAYEGNVALSKVRAWMPDVVLCEPGLTGSSGYQIAKTLRAERNSVRLVAVSANAFPEDVKKALEAGFDAHIAKPARCEEIERLFRP